MNDEPQLYLLHLHDGISVHVCEKCGALVIPEETQTHLRWHDKLAVAAGEKCCNGAPQWGQAWGCPKGLD